MHLGRRSLLGMLLVYAALVVAACGLSRGAACLRASEPHPAPRAP